MHSGQLNLEGKNEKNFNINRYVIKRIKMKISLLHLSGDWASEIDDDGITKAYSAKEMANSNVRQC